MRTIYHHVFLKPVPTFLFALSLSELSLKLAVLIPNPFPVRWGRLQESEGRNDEWITITYDLVSQPFFMINPLRDPVQTH